MNKAYLEKQVKKFSSDYQSELINRFEDQELKELFLKELEDAFRQGFNKGFDDGYKTGLQSGYQQGRMSRPRML